MKGAVEAIMTTVTLPAVVTAQGGMPAASRCGYRASSPRRLRSSSVVIPPWVSNTAGPTAVGRLRPDCRVLNPWPAIGSS
jgi:hypothetical protein